MNKLTRRSIALFLAFVMIFILVPAQVFADDESNTNTVVEETTDVSEKTENAKLYLLSKEEAEGLSEDVLRYQAR